MEPEDRIISLLALNKPEHNDIVITNVSVLMALDSTQGDYYYLLGQAFFQRWKFDTKSEEFILQAIENIDIAIKKRKCNDDNIIFVCNSFVVENIKSLVHIG